MTDKQPMLILHAEDEPAHAELVRRALEQAPIAIRVDQVEDGRQALDYLYRRERYADRAGNALPDLILLDLRMPDIDGLEVLKTIKADPQLLDIPVIALTTSAVQRDLSAAYAHHINSYLVKPVNFSQFKTMMDALKSFWGRWNHPLPKPVPSLT